MSENVKAPEMEETREKAAEKVDPKAILERITRGTLKLTKAIRSRSEDVTELRYDFSKITGWEYVEAMDADRDATNILAMSSKQALCLFSVAAAHENDDLDARDIRERISAVDAMQATQLATLFTVTSARAARDNT